MRETRRRARRTPPPALGPVLRAARQRAGLGVRETARAAGIAHPYLLYLEASQRCPSGTVAARLADVLALDDAERAVLAASTVHDAGRDHPAARARREQRGRREQRSGTWA